MERKYENSANVVRYMIGEAEQKIKEAAETATKVMNDWRFSPEGKEQSKKDIFDELNTTLEHEMNLIRDAASDFCNNYRVKLPEDQKDHSTDIANALKVIDMMGYNMTVDVLKTILEPIKNSYKNMKMIGDIMTAKQKNGNGAGVGYSYDVMDTLLTYMGVNTSIIDYLDKVKEIEDVATNPGWKLRFRVMSYPNATLVQLAPDISYRIVTLPDAIIAAGEMYAQLETEFSDLFKEHIPTDEEMIVGALKNDK